MKITMPSRLLSLILATSLIANKANAGVEPIPTGSFIINMGVSPQTYDNGIKPWGMIYDLLQNYKVQVKWVISQTKLKDQKDFTYNGVDYKGGTIIIPKKYRTPAVDARINYWQSVGVVGVTTTSGFSVDVTYTLKYTPRWTFDFQNGSIGQNYLDLAGIPSSLYPKKYPTELGGCDDLFVMPHAEPTWDEHNNLLYWNQSNRGWLWYGCHAGSVIENLFNPADPTERMNFLSNDGLVPDNQHGDGNPPYEYLNPNDAEMQFMGGVEAACQNGAEQVYLPVGNSGWRPTTKASVHNPTQQNMPALSTGPAAIIVYGRAFGDNTRGKVMMQAGHNFDKGGPDAVAEIRAFFNFSFLSVYDKVIEPQIAPQTTSINSGQIITYSVVLPPGADPNLYSYYWTSSCGTFANPYGASTAFTANTVGACTPCEVKVVITDGCGREYYQVLDLQVCPIPPVAQDILTAMIINNPGTGPQKVGKNWPVAGTDADGWVVNYIIKTLPASGVLFYDNDGNAATPDVTITSLPAGGLIMTKAQAITLKYDPVDEFSNNASFLYTVTDNSGLLDLTPATYTIPVDPPPVAKTFICTPTASNANIYNVCPMEATDEGTIVSYTVVTLPAVGQGKVYLLGVEVDPGQVLTPLQISLLKFIPGGSYVGYAEITYTATDEKGVSDLTPATLTLQLVNQAPQATDRSAPTITDPVGATQTALPALAATDVDGTIASYLITNIPSTSEGILYLLGMPVVNNQTLTLAQANQLKFDPKDNFSGVASFQFTATDNDGLIDNSPATYSIPVKDILPVAANVNNPNINASSDITSINPLVGSDPDSTNVITKYIITQLPDPVEGTLYYDNAGNYVPVVVNIELTPAQGTTLKFDPNPWIGNASFRFTVKDDEGFTDPTSATFKIPIINILPKVVAIASNSIPDTATTRILTPGLSGTDQDGTVEAFVITSLPNPAHGMLSLNGIPISLGAMITTAEAQLLQWTPVLHNANDGKFKFASVDNLLAVADKDATYTINTTFIPWKVPPVSADIINPAINMNAVANKLTPLAGTDADGTIKSFQITQLPAGAHGQLLILGIPVVNNQEIPAANAGDLSFVPSGTFKGTAVFKFRSKDNDDLLSSIADFQIPVSNAKPVALTIAIPPVKKGNTTVIRGLEATDADGTIASYRILSLPTLGTLQYDPTGTNTYVNLTVNQTITPVQATKFRFIAQNVLGTTSFNYSAKDNQNDTSALAVYSIVLAGTAQNQLPVANHIMSAPISFNSPTPQPISALSGVDFDGTIDGYSLSSIPPSFYGTLYYYNTASLTYVPVPSIGFVLTTTQASSLKFQPAGSYQGNVTIRYQAIDDDGGMSAYRILTIPLTNAAPVASNVTNPMVSSADGPTLINSMIATDDGTIVEYFITSLPASTQGVLIMDGIPVAKQQVILPMYLNRLEFDPDPAFTGVASFTFSAKDNTGLVDVTPATFSIPVSNDQPVVDDKLSQVITNQPLTGDLPIPALTGTDLDGTITTFYIQSLPTSGQLYKNGVPINLIPAGGYSLSVAQANQLTFDPDENYSGEVLFTYTAKDNSNNLSYNTASYRIPVNLPPTTSDVVTLAMSPGQPKRPIDPLVGTDDGTVVFYTITVLPPAYAGTLYVNNIPVTDLAQVDSLSPLEVLQLSYAPSWNFDGAIFNYTATDNIGVIDVTPSVYRIPFIPASTLPVKLLSFTGEKAGADNNLKWSTAEETNTDHFEIEYSKDAQHFTSLVSVNGKGNSTSVTAYNYLHKQVEAGTIYYRLKVYDKDGKSDYSNIVVLRRDVSTAIDYSVYPNPFADKITLSVNSESNSKVTVSLLDMSGKMVKSLPFTLQRGNNKLAIDQLGSLVGGTYIMVLRNEQLQVTTKLLKVN